jgi:hypothetical protein
MGHGQVLQPRGNGMVPIQELGQLPPVRESQPSGQAVNFTIDTPDPADAELFRDTAERLRHELAIAWLGHELPPWSSPCRVLARVGPSLGAGGATTFVFDAGQVYGFRSTVQGSQERIIDSVLPHEITHMVLASHFGRPLPRWADEGAAASVEALEERARNRVMLIRFLQGDQGIAFSRMFRMTEYPSDPMPLYAQGASLADFLIQQGGPRKFVTYLADGMERDDWHGATERHYGYRGLGPLQTTWVSWVGRGSPRIDQPEAAEVGFRCCRGRTPCLIHGRRPSPTPRPPTPTPQPNPAPTCQVEINYDRVADLVYARILADVERFRGPQGPPGETGSPNLDELAAEVEKRLQPLYFQPGTKAEPVGDRVAKRLGDTLYLHGYLEEKPD